ncbi:ImmA/IrrE family metallo-endopeptidase [Bacillus sp. FJAT-52991]|uniref:ImmA/IrrE family metallo-endopeptidase n=1 Tax=Bacillus kandeliae TaxID=3129297 RepID=A0ABZ2NC99_9BACI
MDTRGKKIIDSFFEGKYTLENLCEHTYTYYGIIPFASWFSREKRSELYQSALWKLFDSQNKECISIGAFLLLAEKAEGQPSVPIEFAQRALNVWSERKFEDDKVLAYVFNRFPNNRNEWIDILKRHNRFEGEIESKWGVSSLETILHLCSVMMEGERRCKMEQIDRFLPSQLDQKLHLFTKQIIGLVNNKEDISNHFVDELLIAVSNHNLKLSTRMLTFQLLTMKKMIERIGASRIAQAFFKTSINTPSPLGTLLYNVARKMDGSESNKIMPLKIVARSNRYMNDDYSQIKPQVWQEIIHAFHTEIKSTHSVKDLQYSRDFTNDRIVKDLLHKTKMTPPLDLFEMCRRLNILVKLAELPSNIEAFIIKSELADKGMIVLNKHSKSIRRQKFTLAHEIGHFLKHSFPDGTHVLVDEQVELSVHKSSKGTQYVNLEWEKEANDFAHCLLLPSGSSEEKQLKEIQSPFIDKVSLFSDKWEVSMSVLASRIVSITEIEIMLIISENGEIIFSQTSPYWEEGKINLYGNSIPDDSLTYEFIHYDSYSYSKEPNKTNSSIWYEQEKDIDLTEEVFATGYGQVYTFLYK